MFIRSSVLLRTWDLTSESRPACFNLSWVIINISNTRDALAVTVLGCNPIFPAEIYEKRSTGSLLHWENNPFWGTETTVRLMIKSLFYRRKVGHETCEMDWKAVPRIEIAALWSGGLGRGVSTGGEGDAFLRWSGGTFGTSNLLWK